MSGESHSTEPDQDLMDRFGELGVAVTMMEIGEIYCNVGLPPHFDDAISPGHGLWWVSGDKFAECANKILGASG